MTTNASIALTVIEAFFRARSDSFSHFHPLACGRVGLSGPGRALSADKTATLPRGEFRNLVSCDFPVINQAPPCR
jgi:hypothetical protein